MQRAVTSRALAVSRPTTLQKSWLVASARSVGFCVLTAVAAQVRLPVPGTDVPMTLQMLAVLVGALTLPVGEALAGIVLYLLWGAVGLPVFSPGSAGFAGPTAGYLLGFALAVGLIGLVRRRRGASVMRMLLAAGVGAGVVLACGTAWRAMWSGNWAFAAATSALPFVAKTMIEVCLAVAIVRQGTRWGLRAGS